MHKSRALELLSELRQSITQVELFIEEGDDQSVAEARSAISLAVDKMASVRKCIQTSDSVGMSVDEMRDELFQYSGGIWVQVCVRSEDDGGVGSYYLVKGISEMSDTSPTVPIIDLGECIST